MQEYVNTVGVTLFCLCCMENGTKNSENGNKNSVKSIGFNGAKMVKEKQKLHKFCMTAPTVDVVKV